jgi:hypothetical protein
MAVRRIHDLLAGGRRGGGSGAAFQPGRLDEDEEAGWGMMWAVFRTFYLFSVRISALLSVKGGVGPDGNSDISMAWRCCGVFSYLAWRLRISRQAGRRPFGEMACGDNAMPQNR